MIAFLLAALSGYLLGSIPFSFLAGKIFQGIDLRKHGSGNLGASNAFRILGPRIALFVLLFDAAKGYMPVHFACASNQASAAWGFSSCPVHYLMIGAALSAVLGHMFSVFIRFSGGKGIATSAGAFLALSPWAFLGAFAVWGFVFFFTRIVSIASLAGVVSLPLCVFLAGRFGLSASHWSFLALSSILALAVVIKHRGNIQRIVAGTEPALARKKK